MSHTPLTSQERVRRTIVGEPVDRVPIWAPIDWNPLHPDVEADSWKAEPYAQKVIQATAEHCDVLVHVGLPAKASQGDSQRNDRLQAAYGGFFDRRFFLSPTELIDETVETTKDGGTITTYVVHTPKGDVQSRVKVEANVDTLWDIEPLIKEVADVEKLLSVPYRLEEPDLDVYFSEAERLGERGTPVCFVTSPMVMISHLMHFQAFFEWVAVERPLIDRLLDVAYERVAERLQYVLDRGVGPIFRFGGSEQATPPMMSKRMFNQFILKYERPLWQMVRKAGKTVWVHCHGKVNTVIDDFVEGGVQLLDPVEPPPQGDIDIAEAKRRAAAGPMTLIGNIQYSDLCQRSTQELERLVEQAICKGGRQHVILGPTEFPISTIDERLRDNLLCYIEAGVKYGTF